MNDNCRDETPLTEAQLETGFADVWQGLRAMSAVSTDHPSPAFAAELRTVLHSALAEQPAAIKFPTRTRTVAKLAKIAGAVGIAAALALATWIGTRNSPTGFALRPIEIAANPETVNPSVQPELAAVTQDPMPHDLMPHEAVVDSFVETAAQLARLEREIGEMPEAPVAAATLAEQFPYFEKTFEETLGGS